MNTFTYTIIVHLNEDPLLVQKPLELPNPVHVGEHIILFADQEGDSGVRFKVGEVLHINSITQLMCDLDDSISPECITYLTKMVEDTYPWNQA